jgi:uncharacterized membrane protein YbhN (UPF0104 family)
MEALVTVTYSHLDPPVSSEEAMVGILIYRIVYFIIPLAISAGLYLDTLRALLKTDKGS